MATFAGMTLFLLAAAPLAAQETVRPYVPHVVGDERDDYLRALQLVGEARQYPWAVRPFSPLELDRMLPPDTAEVAGPWAHRRGFEPAARPRWGASYTDAHGEAALTSAFPQGQGRGPIWYGRGGTVAATAGVSAWAGPLSVTLAPVLFQTENAAFELADTRRDGVGRFFDPDEPTRIDRPQRFGDDSYGRFDPGASSIRMDTRWVAAGASTATQHWGPLHSLPLMLGPDAPGYPHLFLGTGTPRDILIGHVHARMVWGVMEQSPFSPVSPDTVIARRFSSGLVAVFEPRGLTGLELGLTRFFHIPWREGGPTFEDAMRPLEAFLKTRRGPREGSSDGFSTPDNQLASVFGRWVWPEAGFEVYGEYLRNDHAWDFRDFLLQPDHDASYALGFRRGWRHDSAGLFVLRGEVLNSRVTHLARVRNQVVPYRHSSTRQGHTQQGQILATPAGYGGGAATLALDWWSGVGRIGASWAREIRRHRRFPADEGPETDVVHRLGVDGLVFIGGRGAVTFGLFGVANLNRDYEGDAYGAHARVGARFGL